MYERIKRLRLQAGLKQKDVIGVINCSQQVYSDYENGRVDIPTGVLIALARLYYTSCDYILGVSDYPSLPSGEDGATLLMKRFNALGSREQTALIKLSEFFIETRDTVQKP